LAAGASDVFAVDWFFLDYPGLTLDAASGTNTVGQTQTVTATSLDHGQPVPGETIRYAITGANPSSGVLTTGPTGAAAISWKGTQAGQDTLSAYTDANNDGVFDPGIDTAQTVGVNWSAPPPPAATPPVSTGPPAAAGTAQVGALLTCSPGTWSGSTPQSYAYQWLRDGTPVSPSSAAGSAYKVGAGDAGHGLSCAVTATNAAGSATARSATLSVPAPLSAKFAVVAVRLTAFLARGLATSESCSAACSVTVVAALDPAQARRAGFGHVRQVLGRATGHLTAPGQLNLPIKPSAKIRSRLRRAKLNRLTITLRATTVDGQGQAGPAGVARLVVKR
jgi:hypothetical protein